MADVPTVGGDKNTWGTKLNTFIAVAHETSGSNGGKVRGTDVTNTPAGTISSTNSQNAINEIVADQAASSGASLTGYLPSPGTVATTVQGRLRQNVYISEFASNNISTAIGLIGSTVTTLHIDAEAFCTGTVAFPYTTTVVVLRKGKITKTSGTITFNGRFVAERNLCFSGFDAGDIVFARGSVDSVYPEWWGGNTTPGTTDMVLPLRKAIKAAINYGTVSLTNTFYGISDTLEIIAPSDAASIKIKGTNSGVIGRIDLGGSIIKALDSFSATAMMKVTLSRYVELEDFYLLGTLDTAGMAAAELVVNGGFDSNTSGWTASNATLASVIGGYKGQALEVTQTVTYQGWAIKAVTVEIGRRYTFDCYVKRGPAATSLSGKIYLGTISQQSQYHQFDIDLQASDTDWIQKTFSFVATTGILYIGLTSNASVGNSFLFDSVSVRAEQIGLQFTGAGDKNYIRNVNLSQLETCLMFGDSIVESYGNSGNYLYNVVMEDANYAIKMASSTASLTQLFTCTIGWRTQFAMKSLPVGNNTSASIEMYGGEVSSADVMFDAHDNGTLGMFGVTFNPAEEATIPLQPILLRTGKGNQHFIANFIECTVAFNIGTSWWETTRSLVEFGYAGVLSFIGNKIKCFNPIFYSTDNGGGGEGQTILFQGNTWSHAPNLSGLSYYRIVEDAYAQQNAKSNGSPDQNRDIRSGTGSSLYGHVSEITNGIRTEYRAVVPAFGYWKKGAKVWSTAAAAANVPGWICTETGKMGTLPLCTITIGSFTLTITIAETAFGFSGWEIGDTIVVPNAAAGPTSLTAQITGINTVLKTFTLGTAAGATATDVTITHSPVAVFKPMAVLGA